LPGSPEAALEGARGRGLTIATAESLTGGLVAAALTAVPGASDVFVGGFVTYALGAKAGLLGVPAALLADPGPVSREVALAMAEGVRRTLGADIGLATTGAAGPESHGGQPPGTFWVAAVGPSGSLARTAAAPGGRGEVRAEATNRAIAALCDLIDSAPMAGTRVE
jgi:nicotinamide-nucleotide amidase